MFDRMGAGDRSRARKNNVIWLNLDREPDPPAPRLPGAGALRGGRERAEETNAFGHPTFPLIAAAA
jgi:hypothetical protein